MHKVVYESRGSWRQIGWYVPDYLHGEYNDKRVFKAPGRSGEWAKWFWKWEEMFCSWKHWNEFQLTWMWWGCQAIFYAFLSGTCKWTRRKIWEFSISGFWSYTAWENKPCFGVGGNLLSLCCETSWLDQPKKGHQSSYSPLLFCLQPTKASQRWRGEGQLKIFCLWKGYSEGKGWRGGREARGELQL